MGHDVIPDGEKMKKGLAVILLFLVLICITAFIYLSQLLFYLDMSDYSTRRYVTQVEAWSVVPSMSQTNLSRAKEMLSSMNYSLMVYSGDGEYISYNLYELNAAKITTTERFMVYLHADNDESSNMHIDCMTPKYDGKDPGLLEKDKERIREIAREYSLATGIDIDVAKLQFKVQFSD